MILQYFFLRRIIRQLPYTNIIDFHKGYCKSYPRPIAAGDNYILFIAILSIELVRVDEVLPDDISRGGERGDGVEERLGHPNSEYRILLTQRLAPGGRIAEVTTQRPAYGELSQAQDQSDEGEPQLDGARNVVQVDDESRGATYDDDERDEPQIKRNLSVLPDPPGEPWDDEAA